MSFDEAAGQSSLVDARPAEMPLFVWRLLDRLIMVVPFGRISVRADLPEDHRREPRDLVHKLSTSSVATN
jgi:hypothetical protein